ncbi:SPOR domain-containing protein [sulfur-oxidizing endosymbiont of Gigantopelta aegis]|uniref:SPOR domain-containing protein n=1 Tax=sulfur-oxidizing endosymbiont of Gigantopelta aegis TaxID=2794934 RepID=UPI0018DBCF61|nr:SPOR domain-containing protein [sulfur-oxidizing endosymbiont of Gigantopelta aegis]
MDIKTSASKQGADSAVLFRWGLLRAALISIILLSMLAMSATVFASYEIALKRLNEGDIAGALTLWSKLADAGDVNAQYSVGVLYEQRGEHQSHQKTIHYLNLASKQGMNKAQYTLAMKYFAGYGVEQDFNKTIQLLLKAAAQDYPEAQYQLGRMASDGLGFKQDATEAIRWYLLAAENGFGPAQHTLASHYMTGNGTMTSVDKAVFWLKHAVEQENMLAQRDLGFLYMQGMGVERDFAEAAKLLNNPATLGSPVSQYLLGQLYANGGQGLAKSIRQAKHWFAEAKKSGYPKAEAALAQIAHLPSEPEAETELANAPEKAPEPANEAEQVSEELVQLVDPEAETADKQFYDFYNEDLSAYRSTARTKDDGKDNNMAALDDWQYLDDAVVNLSDDKLVDYKDIDAQFDQAFAAQAKSLGGRGNYKRIFGLAQAGADYELRAVRKYEPSLLPKQIGTASETNKSNSKAIVFQRYNRSGEPQQLGFFSRKVKPVSKALDKPLLKRVAKPSVPSSSTKKAVPKVPSMLVQQAKRPNRPAPVLASLSNIDKSNETDQARFSKLSGDNFTLQILQSNNPFKVKRISQNTSGIADNNLYFLSVNKKNRPLYLVTYGTYANKEQAKNAAKSLPQYVAIGTPWIRKISKVQQQIANL